MVLIKKTIKIEENTLKILEKIAKNKETTENKIVNDFILKGIEKTEKEEEKRMYNDGMDISIVAKEFGQTKEELIKEIEEADARIDAGEGIELDVDKLEERYI